MLFKTKLDILEPRRQKEFLFVFLLCIRVPDNSSRSAFVKLNLPQRPPHLLPAAPPLRFPPVAQSLLPPPQPPLPAMAHPL